ncbi:carbonic anhydrase 2 isoform X2 [Bemisia tabaci]|nr:PREDICTED: carbonic anhydrase 2-like isoform X2 [Bemisia tabaci]
MDIRPPALLIFCLFAGLTADDGRKATTKEFGYEANEDEIPPNSWSEQYGTCSGKYQSPIDIEESLVTRVYLPPLEFTNFNEVPSSAMITNNGHTVMLKYNFSSPASIKGGPLQKEYFFEQMHFHWGTNDSIGSEDLINNHSFPMELHMVFYNSDYGNIDNASNYKDGLVVLATFFEISPFENDVYQTLIKALPDVTEADKKEYLENVPVLASLLPCNPERYFSYLGSLTTPPCLEVVTWIDFKHPVLLSHTQLAKFRTIHSHFGLLRSNFRPVQARNGRVILYNRDFPDYCDFFYAYADYYHYSQYPQYPYA